MRNRISSFLCRFLLVLTLFLPSQISLSARTLADYYPEGVTAGGGEPQGYYSPNYEKEQSKGLVSRSHSVNSGSAGESSTTSSTVDGSSSPTSGSQGTNNFAPPSGGYPPGYYYSGQQQNVYRYESRSSTTTTQSSYNSNGFANYESTTARTVTTGAGDGDSPPCGNCEEEANP